MAALQPILEKLAKAQTGLLRAADMISAEQWSTPPSSSAWSPAEVVSHLITVERTVIGSADRFLQQPPKHFSAFRRLHLPLLLVEARLIRRKTPLPLDPELLGEKEDMLAELREVRGRTLAFLDETSGRDLSAYRWKHPFLGVLNLYDWMAMIAGHEVRHTKQMLEIAAKLPKPKVPKIPKMPATGLPKGIASLQK